MKKLFYFIMVVVACATIVCAAFGETVVPEQPEQLVDLTMLIVGLIAVILGVVAHKLIPHIKANMDENQRKAIAAAAKIAVYAAEQLYGAHRGDEKLEYALKKLQMLGFKVDLEVLRVYVEAAVKELNIQIS